MVSRTLTTVWATNSVVCPAGLLVVLKVYEGAKADPESKSEWWTIYIVILSGGYRQYFEFGIPFLSLGGFFFFCSSFDDGALPDCFQCTWCCFSILHSPGFQ